MGGTGNIAPDMRNLWMVLLAGCVTQETYDLLKAEFPGVVQSMWNFHS